MAVEPFVAADTLVNHALSAELSTDSDNPREPVALVGNDAFPRIKYRPFCNVNVPTLVNDESLDATDVDASVFAEYVLMLAKLLFNELTIPKRK